LGLRVVLDAVFNHCGENLVQFQDVLRHGRASEFHDWFFIDGDKPTKEPLNYRCYGPCPYMPKLNTSNPACRAYVLRVAAHYITEFGIDGWRLDVADEMPHEFWRDFRRAVKSAKPDAVLIGENWHDAHSFLQGDQFDNSMNYAFTKACIEYFAEQCIDEQTLANRLNAVWMRYREDVSLAMFNLLDSHDTHRFITLCGGDPARLRAALALLFLYPGSASVYYGTELDMHGGYDPDCRRCMDWGREPGETAVLIRRLAALKAREPVATGAPRIYAQNGSFYLERSSADRRVTLTLRNREFEVKEELL